MSRSNAHEVYHGEQMLLETDESIGISLDLELNALRQDSPRLLMLEGFGTRHDR
jgi:hypothetical protein